MAGRQDLRLRVGPWRMEVPNKLSSVSCLILACFWSMTYGEFLDDGGGTLGRRVLESEHGVVSLRVPSVSSSCFQPEWLRARRVGGAARGLSQMSCSRTQ